MPEHGTTVRDVAALEVARVGRVEETGNPLSPFRLLDHEGIEIAAVTEFLQHMVADDASPASVRSYAFELLAWFRFLRAVGVPWHRAGRAEARDFALWLKVVKKPPRPDAPAPGSVNRVTGKPTLGGNYAARTRRHARAVIRSFYEYHREMHGRPLVNPFPQAKGSEGLNAHHNPMQPFQRPARRAAYQPKEQRRGVGLWSGGAGVCGRPGQWFSSRSVVCSAALARRLTCAGRHPAIIAVTSRDELIHNWLFPMARIRGVLTATSVKESCNGAGGHVHG
jgi:hypothetical protein